VNEEHECDDDGRGNKEYDGDCGSHEFREIVKPDGKLSTPENNSPNEQAQQPTRGQTFPRHGIRDALYWFRQPRRRAMPSLRIHLNISADEMLDYYRGVARSVHAEATNGKTVQFPASALQKFVTKEGVRGVYDLVFDDQNKFLLLTPCSTPNDGLDQIA